VHAALHCAAAVCSPPQALSSGREWELLEPQLLTPKGYKVLQCCHTALEQLQKVLALQLQQHDPPASLHGASGGAVSQAGKEREKGGRQHLLVGAGDLEAAARLAVGLMCEGRLVPTTWLNEVREPVQWNGGMGGRSEMLVTGTLRNLLACVFLRFQLCVKLRPRSGVRVYACGS
jgi:hypothetical protein